MLYIYLWTVGYFAALVSLRDMCIIYSFGTNTFIFLTTAALKVASYLPLPYSALSSLLIAPTPLRDSIYDYIAKNRYDWFGKDDECIATKDKDILERFIDREEILGGGPSNSFFW